MKLRVVLLFLFVSRLAFSQDNNPGSWNVLNVQYDISSKWEAYSEFQVRSNNFFDDFFYYEIKGGLGYKLSNNFSVLLGTGRYATYSDGGNFVKPFENEEFRIWQQMNMKQHLGRLEIGHRYRIEQKWNTDGYRNRFRYRLSAEVPLNKPKSDAGTVFINVSDEIFLNNKAPHFERNRFIAALGYIISPLITVQTGYVNQYNYSLNKRGGKNYLQLSLLFQLQNEDKGERKNRPKD